MILFEDFQRCECGHARLKKEIFVLATYTKEKNQLATNFTELSERTEVRYSCEKCHMIIYNTRE